MDKNDEGSFDRQKARNLRESKKLSLAQVATEAGLNCDKKTLRSIQDFEEGNRIPFPNGYNTRNHRRVPSLYLKWLANNGYDPYKLNDAAPIYIEI